MKRLLVLALAVGCTHEQPRPISVAPTGTPPRATAVPTGMSPPPPTTVVGNKDAPPLVWGTRPVEGTDFYPLVDGMCIHGRVFRLENAVVFAYGQSHGAFSRGGSVTAVRVEDAGLAPRSNQGFGGAFDTLLRLGGRYPDAMWALQGTGGRMDTSYELSFGNDVAGRWRRPSANSDVVHNLAFVDIDGTFVVSQETLGTNQAPVLMRLSAEGKVISGAKVPGADIARIVSNNENPAVVVRSDGEVFGYDGEKTVVRWSPKAPVKDLNLPGDHAAWPATFIAGKERVWLQIAGKFWGMTGDTIAVSKLQLPTFAGSLRPWAVDAEDSLLVATKQGKLFIETVKGETRAVEMPTKAKLIGFDKGVLWATTEGEGERKSDRFFVKRSGVWKELTIPEAPYARDTRSAPQIEDVTVISEDDIFLNVRRVEKGLGWKDSEPYRVIYRTKKPNETLRCRDVRGSNSGIGLWSWPPRADASCKTPFLVITEEPTKKGRTSYPGIAAQLKGETALGAQASFMHFEAQGALFVGMKVPSVSEGERIGAKLSSKLDLRTELVCGDPSPVQAFTFDVAKGAFSFAP